MIEENQSIVIESDESVTVTRMNHILEVQFMQRMNRHAHIKKLDKERYIYLETGEIKEFDISKNRSENFNSLRQTFKKLRYLINNNFIGADNELHVILTYAENMTDTKRLYYDFDKFMKRLRYSYRNESTIDYISVVEPQERGAWHIHLLLRFNDIKSIYVKSEDMANMWGHGFVKVKGLKDVDNIGAYLSAYLTDIELNDSSIIYAIKDKLEIKTIEVEGVNKRFIKGGRLYMYPSGMNLYRKSKGIKYPERERMRFKEVNKIVGNAKPHYEKIYEIENKDFKNIIIYKQYNLKRI